MMYRLNTIKSRRSARSASLLPPGLLPPFPSIEKLLSAVYAEGYGDAVYNNSPQRLPVLGWRKPLELTVEVRFEQEDAEHTGRFHSGWVRLASRVLSMKTLRSLLREMGHRLFDTAGLSATIDESADDVLSELGLFTE